MNVFEEQGYYLIENFFSREQVADMYNIYNELYNSGKLTYEHDVLFRDVKVYQAMRDRFYDYFQSHYDYATNKLSYLMGTELVQTYQMGRVYTSGTSMKAHIDRVPCEVSITFTIAHNKVNWPIHVLNKKGEPVKVETPPGSAMLYAGDKALHWREMNTYNDIQYQHFMHWVDKSTEQGSLLSLFDRTMRASGQQWPSDWKKLVSDKKVPVIDV